MDNASKALVMAGGLLIAMAIIGLAVATFSHASEVARANEEAMSTSQIESFNRFYTAYSETYTGSTSIRCIDAVNILNRAVEDEVDVSLNITTDYIKENGTGDAVYYTADPANYTTKNVNYELRYLYPVGIVNRIIITD